MGRQFPGDLLVFFRRRGAVAAGLLLLLLGACAPSLPTVLPGKAVETLPAPPIIPHGEGRIWQVERPGQEPSYLFGTIHVTNPEVFELSKTVQAAFDDARFAAFETSIDEELDEEEKKVYVELPEDTRLYDVLGEETYQQMKALAFFRFFRVDGLDRMQPWVVWTLVAGREISADIDHDSENPVLDDWLQTRAVEDGKQVVPLETEAQQLNIFAGMSMDDQISMLRSAIDGYGDPHVKVSRVKLYLEGKLAQRYALWQRLLGQMDPAVAQRFHERILDGRNRTMVESLLPLFEQGSTFVAVGALHMPGEEGILSLLERRGYSVTRLE